MVYELSACSHNAGVESHNYGEQQLADGFINMYIEDLYDLFDLSKRCMLYQSIKFLSLL